MITIHDNFLEMKLETFDWVQWTIAPCIVVHILLQVRLQKEVETTINAVPNK